MRRSWEKLALVFSVAILTLQGCAPTTSAPASQDAEGYVENSYGERVSWKGAVPITMHMDSTVPAQYKQAIQDAANIWNKAAGYTLFTIVDGANNSLDRQNVITFAKTWDATLLLQQAKTDCKWLGDQMQEADISINASSQNGVQLYNWYYGTPTASSINIVALVLHELGHVLGLKHKDAGSSVMATYLPNDDDRTVLAPTDLESLHYEY